MLRFSFPLTTSLPKRFTLLYRHAVPCVIPPIHSTLYTPCYRKCTTDTSADKKNSWDVRSLEPESISKLIQNLKVHHPQKDEEWRTLIQSTAQATGEAKNIQTIAEQMDSFSDFSLIHYFRICTNASFSTVANKFHEIAMEELQPGKKLFVELVLMHLRVGHNEKARDIYNQELHTSGQMGKEGPTEGFPWSRLQHAFLTSGDLETGMSIFECRKESERLDNHAWASLITAVGNSGKYEQAIALWNRMLREGFEPDDVNAIMTIPSVIGLGNKEIALEFFETIIQRQVPQTPKLRGKLLDMLCKCGQIDVALKFFKEKDPADTDILPLWSYACLMNGFVKNMRYSSAIGLWDHMIKRDLFPNTVCATLAVTAASKLADKALAIRIHQHIVQYKVEQDTVLRAHLLLMYNCCRAVEESVAMFNIMVEDKQVNTKNWTMIMDTYNGVNQPHKAIEYWNRMASTGDCIPDEGTVRTILGSLCAIKKEGLMKKFKANVDALNITLSTKAENLFLGALFKCNCVKDAVHLFKEMTGNQRSDIYTWRIMIDFHVKTHKYRKAIVIWQKFLAHPNKEADEILATSILSAVGALQDDTISSAVFQDIYAFELHSKRRIRSQLLHVMCKCGDIQNALQIFEKMFNEKQLDSHSWNIMINGLASSEEHAEKALELFGSMVEEGVSLDDHSLLNVLKACSRSNKVALAVETFDSLKSRYNITPNLYHFRCLMGLLRRNGDHSLADQYEAKFPQFKQPKTKK